MPLGDSKLVECRLYADHQPGVGFGPVSLGLSGGCSCGTRWGCVCYSGLVASVLPCWHVLGELCERPTFAAVASSVFIVTFY